MIHPAHQPVDVSDILHGASRRTRASTTCFAPAELATLVGTRRMHGSSVARDSRRSARNYGNEASLANNASIRFDTLHESGCLFLAPALHSFALALLSFFSFHC